MVYGRVPNHYIGTNHQRRRNKRKKTLLPMRPPHPPHTQKERRSHN